MANLSLNARGAEVKELHARLAKLGVSIPKRELDEEVFGAGTQSALLNFQANHKLRRTGVLDDRTRAALARAVAKAEIGQPRVEGRVFFENGLPAAGVTIRAYHRGFGGAETQLGEETTTDPQGFYTISYDPPGRRAANLELRVVGAAGQESSLCATKFHAERHEVMNLVVPTKLRPPASEFERLNADLGKQLGESNRLADAREGAERQDLTFLHRATGWDARLIALAATADKLDAETRFPPGALYALFRAGLPTNKELFARVSVTAVLKALAKANDAGIVNLADRQITVASSLSDLGFQLKRWRAC